MKLALVPFTTSGGRVAWPLSQACETEANCLKRKRLCVVLLGGGNLLHCNFALQRWRQQQERKVVSCFCVKAVRRIPEARLLGHDRLPLLRARSREVVLSDFVP